MSIKTRIAAFALATLAVTGTTHLIARHAASALWLARYMERIPGCFLRVGAREPDGVPIAAHSPHFAAAEDSIFVGAAVLAESARVASEALAARG